MTTMSVRSLQDGAPAVWAALRESGVVLLKDAASTPEAFEAVTERFATEFRIHQDATRRRYNDADTMQSVTAGSDAIGLHAERAYLPARPELLFFCCLTPPSDGGATTVCDGAAVVDALSSEDVRRWERMTLRWRTSLNPRMWQRLWSTGDPAEAVRRLDAMLERHGERDSATYAFDGEAALEGKASAEPPDGPTLYIDYQVPSVAAGWISGRPAFANYLLLAAQEETGPQATQVDGTPVPDDLLQRAASAADRLTVDIAWTHGDIAFIDNTRCLHGRRAFAGGDRQILVRMGDALPQFRHAMSNLPSSDGNPSAPSFRETR